MTAKLIVIILCIALIVASYRAGADNPRVMKPVIVVEGGFCV